MARNRWSASRAVEAQPCRWALGRAPGPAATFYVPMFWPAKALPRKQIPVESCGAPARSKPWSAIMLPSCCRSSSARRYHMDEIFGRRDLIAREKLKELLEKSDLLGALRVGSHLSVLAPSTAALLLSWVSVWAIP